MDECAGCGRLLFPARLRCPNCGNREFRRVRLTIGIVEEITTRPGAAYAIATVRSRGVAVIARVPTTAKPGDEVRLTSDPQDGDAAFVR